MSALVARSDAPFFHARSAVDGVRTAGAPTHFAGYAVERRCGGRAGGVFAEWRWDGDALTVRNDRYGFHPLFYFARDDEVCVSTSLLPLLERGGPTDLDAPALAVFLRLGYFVGEDTPFRAIRAVAPSTTLTWRRGAGPVLDVGRAPTAVQRVSREAAVDGFITLFREAMLRVPPDGAGAALPLSGGKDSRHILLELCASGRRPRVCVTARYFPPFDDKEVVAASAIAAALDVEHHVLRQTGSAAAAELEKNVRASFCALEHGWYLAVADFLAGKAATVYDGIGGDVLSSGHVLTAERLSFVESGDAEGFARHLLDGAGADPALRVLLEGALLRRASYDAAVERLAHEFRRCEDEPNPIAAFTLANKTRRSIAPSPYGILREVPQVYCPYLDPELYDFLASLPVGLTVDRRLHVDAIARAYPRYADVPYNSKRWSPVGDHGHFRRFAWQTAAHLLRARTEDRFLNRAAVVPRLARCVADRSYSQSVNWLATVSLYLLQLEAVARGQGATPGF